MLKYISLLLFQLVFLFSCSNLQPEAGKKETELEKEKTLNDKFISGRVVGVSDGDTFKLLVDGNQTVRVRLYGIDAPEKTQDYGTQAKQALSDLVFSKNIQVEQKNKDRYGRIVGVAYADGLNVNEELLKSGFVWHYKEYDKTVEWARLEEEARQKRTGLWRKPNPTPPWQFRKEKRAPKAVRS